LDHTFGLTARLFLLSGGPTPLFLYLPDFKILVFRIVIPIKKGKNSKQEVGRDMQRIGKERKIKACDSKSFSSLQSTFLRINNPVIPASIEEKVRRCKKKKEMIAKERTYRSSKGR